MIQGGESMRNVRGSWLASVVAILLLAMSAAPGWGQRTYGTIGGTATDASGAAVAEATVTLINLDNGGKQSITTDTSGNYTFVNIQPGRYKLEGEKSGFKKFVREPIL